MITMDQDAAGRKSELYTVMSGGLVALPAILVGLVSHYSLVVIWSVSLYLLASVQF